MDSIAIKWIFWTVIGVAGLALAMLLLRGPPPQRPLDCTSSAVTDTVLDIVEEHGGSSKYIRYSLDKPHKMSAEDPGATSIGCAVRVWIGDADGMPFNYADLTYTVERDATGKITVTVAAPGVAELRHFP